MRKLRLALLLGVTIILTGVTWDYFDSRRANISVRLAEPQEIPSHLNAQATRWTWSQSSGDRRSVEGSAARFRQTKDTGVFELEGVELRIFHQDETAFDLVETPQALFYSREGRLYSEAPVTLTLALSESANFATATNPTIIRSTGVTFESRFGTCATDRYTEYDFDGGNGHSVGAFYDSINRYLHMKSEVYLERFAEQPSDSPVRVRAAELFYHERGERVDLKGGVSLERGPQHLEATDAVVYLSEGAVKRIEATEARGTEQQPGRAVTFTAQWLETLYAPNQVLERVTGMNPAELTSVTSTSTTTVSGRRIDLSYKAEPQPAKQSQLQDMHARGEARVEVRPLEGVAGTSGDVRRVSADWLHLVMRPEGGDIDRVQTVSPGEIEILPRVPSRPRRLLKAERITAHYAPHNRMETLRAAGQVTLENHRPQADDAAKDQAPLLTRSEDLEAHFQPDSGDLESLRQWTDFRFTRGQRHGQSHEAEFEQLENRLVLRQAARVWDENSNVSAKTIVLDERTGDLLAEDGVTTRYDQPSSAGQETNGRLFSGSQPVFASADRMVSLQEQGKVDYHGAARLWQGQDRIEANHITILRQASSLSAEGKVFSDLPAEQGSAKDATPKDRKASRMVVTAQSLHYDEGERHVVYRKNVELKRGSLLIQAQEIDGWFEAPDSGGAQRLEKAVARGAVTILQRDPTKQSESRGFGQQAVYEPLKEMIRLRGSPARLIDASGDETGGPELTYRLNDDRLLVQGGGEDRAYSVRRHKQP